MRVEPLPTTGDLLDEKEAAALLALDHAARVTTRGTAGETPGVVVLVGPR